MNAEWYIIIHNSTGVVCVELLSGREGGIDEDGKGKTTIIIILFCFVEILYYLCCWKKDFGLIDDDC